LSASVKTKKWRYFGHIMRHNVLKRYHPRKLIRKEEKRKTKDNMVRQHHPVDRYGLGKSTESDGQEKSTEKNDPWCSQPSEPWDRG